MRNVVLVIFIMIAVVSCGDGGSGDGTGGIGGQSITPVDNQSVTSLYGTYSVISFDTFDNLSNKTTFTGDNVTGELVIDSTQIRYRVEYDNGVNSYYSFNLLDSQSRTEYEEIINAIKNGTDGSYIKNSNEIQLGDFGLKKVSDFVKDLKAEHGSSGPYNFKLTPIKVNDVWHLTGTYYIREITYIAGWSPITIQKDNIGIISFIDKQNTQLCEDIVMYKIWADDVPSDKPVIDSCTNFMLGSDNLSGKFSTSKGQTYLGFELVKLYDAVGF